MSSGAPDEGQGRLDLAGMIPPEVTLHMAGLLVQDAIEVCKFHLRPAYRSSSPAISRYLALQMVKPSEIGAFLSGDDPFGGPHPLLPSDAIRMLFESLIEEELA